MKWMYNELRVEITVTFDTQDMGVHLTPMVEIDRKDGAQTALTTTRSFPNSEMAEEFGMGMAREWIDKNFP